MSRISIVVTSDYGVLSRGRHSARCVSCGDVKWAQKNAQGQLVITEPGQWLLHCTDGFKRSARGVIIVDDSGAWEMAGGTNQFEVLE